MYPLKNLKHFYYINLAHRTDRNNFIQQQIQNSTLLKNTIKRYEGINRNTINPIDYIGKIITKEGLDSLDKTKFNFGTTLGYGSLCCAIAHYNLYEKCIQENYTHILIFEDDIIIPKNINSLLYKIDNIPFDYDIFYLGYHRLNNIKKKEIDKNYSKLVKGGILGCFAYIVSVGGCDKIMKQAFPITKQFDSEIAYLINRNKLEAYCFTNEKEHVRVKRFSSDAQNRKCPTISKEHKDIFNEVFKPTSQES